MIAALMRGRGDFLGDNFEDTMDPDFQSKFGPYWLKIKEISPTLVFGLFDKINYALILCSLLSQQRVDLRTYKFGFHTFS